MNSSGTNMVPAEDYGKPSTERHIISLGSQQTGGPNIQTLPSPVTITTSNLVAIGTENQVPHKQVVAVTTLPLTSSAPIVRPATTTPLLQTSHIPVSTTYHVPRGAAAVANISAPRSAVATPIVRVASNIQTIGVPAHPTSYVTGLRGIGPRTLTPVVGTTWLSSSTIQPVTNIPRGVFPQGRPTSMTVTARPMGIQVTRMQSEPLKQSAGHKPITLQPVQSAPPSQVQEKNFFKTTMSVQSPLGAVTIAQLLPARSQGLGLTYTNPLTAVPVSSPFPLSSTHQLVQTTGPSISRQTVLPSTTVRHVTTPGRISVTTQSIATSVPGSVVTVSGAPRLTTLPNTILSPIQNAAILSAPANRGAVLTSHTRLTLPRGTVTNPTVIATMGTAANTVINTPARLTASSPSPIHQGSTLLTAQVINQPVHGPSIHLAQVPATSFTSKIPQTLHGVMPIQQTALAITTMSGRPGPLTTSSTLTMSNIRPVTMATAPTRVYSQQQVSEITLQQTQQHPVTLTQQNILQGTNIYIQTSHRQPTAGNSNPVYFYETSSYPVTGLSSSLVARPYQPATSSPYTLQNPTIQGHQVHGTLVTSGAPVRFNQVMVMDPSSTTMPVHSYMAEGGLLQTDNTAVPASPNHNQILTKPNASPRPSILRKRDNEGSPMKAQKNLTPVLAALGNTSGPSSPPSPRCPDSRDNGGGSSNGSTTISATSSPGLGEAGDDSQPSSIKLETIEESGERPPVEMSPRKKPRKQQLTGNDLHEPKFSEDDMEFISDEKLTKDVPEATSEEYQEEVYVPKRPKVSLKSSYRHTWKSQNNHFIHYDNVKPKDTRPTINDLANQKGILEKLNGWKIYHLSTQMEEMSDLESNVVERLSSTLKVMEVSQGKDFDKDVNRINELIKGNIQRSKVIKDQMEDSVSQVMKIFDHKEHVTDILARCANKRSFKKREKT